MFELSTALCSVVARKDIGVRQLVLVEENRPFRGGQWRTQETIRTAALFFLLEEHLELTCPFLGREGRRVVLK